MDVGMTVILQGMAKLLLQLLHDDGLKFNCHWKISGSETV